MLPVRGSSSGSGIERLRTCVHPFLLHHAGGSRSITLGLPSGLRRGRCYPLATRRTSLCRRLIRSAFTRVRGLSKFRHGNLVLRLLDHLGRLYGRPTLCLGRRGPGRILRHSMGLRGLDRLIDTMRRRKRDYLVFARCVRVKGVVTHLLGGRFKFSIPFLGNDIPGRRQSGVVDHFRSRRFPIFLLSLGTNKANLGLATTGRIVRCSH